MIGDVKYFCMAECLSDGNYSLDLVFSSSTNCCLIPEEGTFMS